MTEAPATVAASPAWHRPEHTELRKRVMVRLREHPVLAVNPALQRDAAQHGLPSLLQRLEWMLYHAAHSLHEYANPRTLERRVQALVTHYKRRSCSLPAAATPSSGDIIGRTRSPSSIDTDEPSCKRQHLIDDTVELSIAVGNRRCLLSHNVDLVRYVFGFLDGRETLRCRAVSRFLRVHAPSFVHNLQLDATAARATDLDTPHVAELLTACGNLETLSICCSANATNIKAGVVFPRALSQATAATPASFGFQTVSGLAEAIERGGCRKLETLKLTAPFDFANESDAVLRVLSAIAKRSASPRTRLLKRLVLDATFLGDKGIVELAGVLNDQPTAFAQIESLCLRNNFVGEGGCHALLKAVSCSLPRLRSLDLRANILTNTDAIEIADLLDEPIAMEMSRVCREGTDHEADESKRSDSLSIPAPRLRRIRLDGNFISSDGFHAISIALCARREAVRGATSQSDGSDDGYDEDDDTSVTGSGAFGLEPIEVHMD